MSGSIPVFKIEFIRLRVDDTIKILFWKSSTLNTQKLVSSTKHEEGPKDNMRTFVDVRREEFGQKRVPVDRRHVKIKKKMW